MNMKITKSGWSPAIYLGIQLLLAILILTGTGSAQEYVLIGWNDLGMHCANKDFSKMAVLPPYNNVLAQLIRKTPGELPQIVTTGYVVEYSIPNNTYSVGKTNFWTYAQELFGLAEPLPPNIGLTGKGLSGTMDTAGGYFRAGGIPITPYTDTDLINESPFQLIHLVARESGGTAILAQTDVVIPVSNEISCVQSGCHASEQAMIDGHETVAGFNTGGSILCAKCHASNALGTTGQPEAKSLSFRMHDEHKEINPLNSIETCYKCHPGPKTQCLRDVMRTGIETPLVCQNCHGSLPVLAQSIENGRRPWLDEPRCGNTLCHGSTFEEQPGKLYRASTGHGGMFCSACHGSPHAILPTVQPNDNLQNIRLQGHSGPLKDCLACHSTPPDGPGPHSIRFADVQRENVPCSLNDGWNLVSIPVTPNDPAVRLIYPEATSAAFSFGGTYVEQTTLVAGKGYWLKFGELCQQNMNGYRIDELSVDVRDGWNLIGSITSPIPVSFIRSVPRGIVTSEFIEYQGVYGTADTIFPGRAYWVKLSQSATLVLTNHPISSDNSPIRIVPTDEAPPAPPSDNVPGLSAPAKFALEQNYPNPFNPSTTITFSLRSRSFVSLKVFDILGREVSTLVAEQLSPGTFTRSWDGGLLPSGTYYYILKADGLNASRSLLLLK